MNCNILSFSRTGLPPGFIKTKIVTYFLLETVLKHQVNLNVGFMKASCTLNMLMRHYIDEERNDESLIGVEIILWG